MVLLFSLLHTKLCSHHNWGILLKYVPSRTFQWLSIWVEKEKLCPATVPKVLTPHPTAGHSL
jgi:hypothetical protein